MSTALPIVLFIFAPIVISCLVCWLLMRNVDLTPNKPE